MQETLENFDFTEIVNQLNDLSKQWFDKFNNFLEDPINNWNALKDEIESTDWTAKGCDTLCAVGGGVQQTKGLKSGDYEFIEAKFSEFSCEC